MDRILPDRRWEVKPRLEPDSRPRGREPQALGSIDAGWRSRLIRTGDEGKPLAILANALIALEHAPEWRNVVHSDRSRLAVVAKIKPPWTESRSVPFLWEDRDDIQAAAWLQHEGILVGAEIVRQAIQAIAARNSFHPIIDYLDALEWDETPRIDRWLTVYAGADDVPYTRAVGSRWLISGVARICQPGCKCDTCLILEGVQGAGKSSAFGILGRQFYTDDLGDLGSKDAALQLRGAWIVELSELNSLARAEASRIKAFMSRSADRYRPPYGRRVIEVPRECIFAGTVNHVSYLRDETGGRRFWPVKTGKINLRKLEHDRDQLWAEAVVRYGNGDPWWLDRKSLVRLAATEQRSRYESDPWEPKVSEWLEGRESASVSEILELCIQKSEGEWTQADQTRVARCLVALGWVRFRDGSRPKRPWRYRPDK